MNRITIFILIAIFASIFSCQSSDKKGSEELISIKTEFGEIKVKLYDETPEHKKNFLKLVNDGFYNDLLFHRVIDNFMIQGGDPDSKGAQPGVRLGGGSPGYTIPAEFAPKYYHKKGALAAARKGGPSNPEKKSSGSQFYIIHGKIFRSGELDTMIISKNSKFKNELLKKKVNESSDELNEFRTNNDQQGFNLRIAEIREQVDSVYGTNPKFTMSEEQINAYTTIGGYPSLDGEYTVFGEVVEGFDVLDKIAAVEVDQRNRPKADVKMQVELVK
jgi:cyclophilin family peptidyl-prolyl cis-trans isomerase